MSDDPRREAPDPVMISALTAAMAMVPGLYSRNRMFALFADPLVRRARSRARSVRGLLRFVGRADAVVHVVEHDGRARITYRIPRLRLSRAVQVTDFELALLRVIVARGEHPSVLHERPGDRARIDAALLLLPKDAVSSVA